MRFGGQLARGAVAALSGGVSGRAGRAEASAADDLLEFSQWKAAVDLSCDLEAVDLFIGRTLSFEDQ
jgi:hypothetical protein